MKSPVRVSLLAVALCLFVLGSSGDAQLEGSDRGIAPIDSASSFEVTGVDVDVTGPDGQKAREEGYREAQRKGWQALWAKTSGRPLSEAPSLSDSQLDNMVSGIVVEQEQIGAHRYIATLGVLFDRARTSDVLGVGGVIHRSAPMLVIPVMLTGSTFTSFEYRNPWQAAWARFRTGNSPVDYVRPVGNGIDPLLLNEAQTHRPGRAWWRMILDQYGASDVVIPEVRLQRLWPGGPTIGTFTARKGPDNQVLGSFTLRVENSAAIPKLLDEGVRRLDLIYAAALDAGQMKPDPTLAPPPPPPVVAVPEEATTETPELATAPIPAGQTTTFAIQVDTPDAAAVGRAELGVSRVPGVTSAITTSLALGGTSVMRVTFQGDSAAFRAALQAQGWQVTGSGTTLRISKGGGA
ncbi:MAG TPA: heavy-metal-associated domain-containing protein [Allosphingosinicella sp.]|nr:heavy-metal-associated domain-containing protein [Allosphingosinicella sp.]